MRGLAITAVLALCVAAMAGPGCEVRGGSGLRVVGPGTILRENAQQDYVRERRAYFEGLRARRDTEARLLLEAELVDLAAWWSGHLAAERARAANHAEPPMPSWEDRNVDLSWLTNGCQVIEAVAARRSVAAVAPLRRIVEEGKGDGDVVLIHCAIEALGRIGDREALPDLRRYLDAAAGGCDPAFAAVANPYNRRVLEEAVRALE